MKFGDTGLDDLLNKLLSVLDQDGRWHARFTRWAFVQTCRAHKTAMLLTLG
jgi:hypothetical protein